MYVHFWWWLWLIIEHLNTASYKKINIKSLTSKCTKTNSQARQINHTVSKTNLNILNPSTHLNNIHNKMSKKVLHHHQDINLSNHHSSKTDKFKWEDGNGLTLLFKVSVHVREAVIVLHFLELVLLFLGDITTRGIIRAMHI